LYLSCAQLPAVCNNNYETKVDYTVLNETITACTTNARKLVVPRSIDGNSVTAIGNRAFSDNSSMISVEISDGITELKDESFYNCSTLREVYIPKSAVYISPTAFTECPALTKIEVDFDNGYMSPLMECCSKQVRRILCIFLSDS
jgi:hypothetical protein